MPNLSRRVAFLGASGTGKTTLARFVAELYEIPLNPVGSRSVAEAMGFGSPYEVDAAGKRAEFQRRLLDEKCAWEAAHDAFVSDRTTLDVLAYTALHEVRSIDDAFVAAVKKGLSRYTHVIYCAMEAFCKPGGDPARVQDAAYHFTFDVLARAFLKEPSFATDTVYPIFLTSPLYQVRQTQVRAYVGEP
jgi:predicted ATPase